MTTANNLTAFMDDYDQDAASDCYVLAIVVEQVQGKLIPNNLFIG
jgi:hypothetical protein